MAHLTPKENILRTMRGEIPEWVPSYSYYGPLPGVDEDPPNMSIMIPAMFGDMMDPENPRDMWGVPYTSVEEVGGFSLPTPDKFILEDITKWRDVVKAPDVSDVDWEFAVKQGVDMLPYSRDNVALIFGPCGLGYFQELMALMGFTEGLCAMYEEPDAVKELFAYMHDYNMGVAREILKYVTPDILGLVDDTAAERAPFISREMYREFLLPLYDDAASLGRNLGIPIDMHNCGKSEIYFDDLVRIGVTSWEPVQLSNDIHEMQRKYGRHLVIGGGWESRGRLIEDDVTDEEIRESVRVCLDEYAPNAGFMFAGAYTPGKTNDEVTQHRNEVLQREVYDYGHTFYK